MNYWLIKSEPGVYSFSQLRKDKKTFWDGVRNYQARNFMRSMAAGDLCVYFHTEDERSAVGLAKVLKTAYPDPTATEGDWSCVDVAFEAAFPRPVTLAEIKSQPVFEGSVLLRQGRLSVVALKKEEFDNIVALAHS